METVKLKEQVIDLPDDSKIRDIENQLLQGLFGCRSTEAVEGSVTYAQFLSSVGITPENYPVFLGMLEIENHWVVDALIGDRDPFLLLSGVQPNKFIVGRILAMMTRWHRGGIYSKNLSVILGVLQSVYSSPRDGYRIYPLTIADSNAIGKHLDKEKGQDEPLMAGGYPRDLNRAILEVLDKIAQLEDAGDTEMEEVAIHAAAIRNAFFDDTKRMEDVIPPVLLVTDEHRHELAPREQASVSQVGSTSSSAKDKPFTGGQKSRDKEEPAAMAAAAAATARRPDASAAAADG
jgi:hypothetical protein